MSKSIAYVGVIEAPPAARMLQYFLSLCAPGLIGPPQLGVLNIIFGVVAPCTLLLGPPRWPFRNASLTPSCRVIDVVLVFSGFSLMGFVMPRGAWARTFEQQFGLPAWAERFDLVSHCILIFDDHGGWSCLHSLISSAGDHCSRHHRW